MDNKEKHIQQIGEYNDKFRVVGYLPPMYSTLFNAYVKYSDETTSSCLRRIVKHFFDDMPEREKTQMVNFSKNSY